MVHALYFSDHKLHLAILKCVPYNAVCVMYESGCTFPSRTNFMWQTVLSIQLLVTIFL